eukprot:gene17561-23885_t
MFSKLGPPPGAYPQRPTTESWARAGSGDIEIPLVAMAMPMDGPRPTGQATGSLMATLETRCL